MATGSLRDRRFTGSTASTICNRVSTGTGSFVLLKIELPVTVEPETLPESLTH
jgi:hypothetical protein